MNSLQLDDKQNSLVKHRVDACQNAIARALEHPSGRRAGWMSIGAQKIARRKTLRVVRGQHPLQIRKLAVALAEIISERKTLSLPRLR